MIDKDYEVIRYYRSGFKPMRIHTDLTEEEAQAIARRNNESIRPGEILGRLWIDLVQKKGLY